MKTFLLICLFSASAWASGPNYKYSDPKLNDEIENIYKDLKYPNIVNGRASTMTVTYLSVSTTTVKKIVFSDGTTQITAPGSTTGRILQTVTATTNTSFSTTSTSFADSSLTASITPQFSTSKILVMASGSFTGSNPAVENFYATIRRGTTNLAAGTKGFATAQQTGRAPCMMAILDAPATTSATSYVVSVRTISAAASAQWSDDAGIDQKMTLLEISQ